MKSKIAIAALLLTALTACGGSVEFNLSFRSGDGPFVIWAGNSNRDQVVDANNHVFSFFADSGCLYNFQTGRKNRNFCLTSAGDTALYGGFSVRIANVHSSAGICVAALLDEVTGHFIDIEIDSLGREVIFVTGLHADFCSV